MRTAQTATDTFNKSKSTGVEAQNGNKTKNPHDHRVTVENLNSLTLPYASKSDEKQLVFDKIKAEKTTTSEKPNDQNKIQQKHKNDYNRTTTIANGTERGKQFQQKMFNIVSISTRTHPMLARETTYVDS